VVERHFLRGSIAFSSDSYLFSNEAMLRERHPKLLARFIGSAREVVFDETHLGIGETPTLMALARRYRLYGPIGTILLLALLFVWKNAAHFVPPHEEPSGRDGVSIGRDAAAGFVSLLCRTIPAREVLRVCVEEWSRAFSHEARGKGTRRARIDAIVAEHAQPKGVVSDPVAAYQSICEVLSERKGKP
jgi:hypothetical protein